MLWVPPNAFGLILTSTADGTRPAAGMGNSVTPVQDATNGTYVSLIAGASVTSDVCGIEILVNNVGISATARDALVTIGLDAAGGTSFTDLVSLVCGPAAPYITANASGGTRFYFPLWIKSGTSIGARASVHSATLTAFSVFVRLYCQPTHPAMLYVGSYVDAYGVTTATSAGTAITPGGASDGTYTSIGTLSRGCRYLDFGYGVDDSTMTSNAIDVDIAIGTAGSKKLVIMNSLVVTNAVEQLTKLYTGQYCTGVTNDILYARCQVGPSGADSNNSIAIYAVGG